MKITKSLINSYKKVKSNNSLNFYLSDNDDWNKSFLKITKKEYNTLLRLDRLTGGLDNFSLNQLNEFLKEGWV